MALTLAGRITCCMSTGEEFPQMQQQQQQLIQLHTQTYHRQNPQPSIASATPSRTVSLFWDLDNKPPTVAPASLTARRLLDAASAFGRLHHTIALANRPAVIRLREETFAQRRQDREILDILERRGAIKPLEPYICNLCGRKCPTNLHLQRHFKQLHQREQEKRMNRLGQLKGNRRVRYAADMVQQTARYREAYSGLHAVNRAGYVAESAAYGLERELRAAGMRVWEVRSKAWAVEEMVVSGGVEGCVLCLVSDDVGMAGVVKVARGRGVKVVVVGSVGGGAGLGRCADGWLRWEEVAVGVGRAAAVAEAKKWLAQEMLTRELVEVDETPSWEYQHL